MSSRQGETDSGRLWPADSSHSKDLVTAYCDGGSRGNPGPAGFGVFIQGADGETVAELSEYLGKHTNNYAEYSALLASLDFALTQGHPRLKVVSDSELMVKQIKGQYKVNSPELRPLYEEAKRRIARLDAFQIQHVLREKNQRADRLANLAMDRGMGRTGSDNGRTSSTGLSSGSPSSGSSSRSPASASAGAEKPQMLRGFVKGGVVHLVEGELPDGIFVRITPERR
ncbi:putative phosphoglycerate mutase [Silvibacterium bohemicum]|uniref:Putative phosphoglycerate mutase n=1 Tax=Silvibacterium bohemicum TaxID=1577686 RepID=A0A841K4Q8_9BACT|nr:ribonuclease HI family protein [Silvibacterium bohemicum]MBB6146929.1 putative phosphoglycerate mutase [Silvibacterium bohemicum]